MTPSELESHKEEILSRKLVSSAQYTKLFENSQIKEKIDKINESNVTDISEEEKERIKELKKTYANNISKTGIDAKNLNFNKNSGLNNNEFVRPEQYDLTADISHNKDDDLRSREQQQQELTSVMFYFLFFVSSCLCPV